MAMADELNSQVVFLKAQELTLRAALKDTHDNLMLAIGKVSGYQEAKAELEKKFGLPLTPEIEAQVIAIIRDVKAKATVPEAPK